MKRVSLIVLSVLLLTLIPAPLAASAPATQLYTVVFNQETLPTDAAGQVAAAGGEVVMTIPEIGVLQARAPGGFVGKMLRTGLVKSAGPSLPVTLEISRVEVLTETEDVDWTKANLWSLQWDIKRVTNNGLSFAISTGTHDVMVAVIDTGILPFHPALSANFLGGRNFVPAGGFGGDPTESGDPNDFTDRHGHGTHCAGTIAANGRVLGVGPDLAVRAYRCLTAEGSGSSLWIIAAMVAAADDGCKVLSMSLGGWDIKGQVWWTDPVTGETFKLGNDVADFNSYQRAVAHAGSHGALVVSSAGNDGWNCSQKGIVTKYLNDEYGPLGYTFVGASYHVPSAVAGAICVSATGPDESLASYSNYGGGYIHIAAPGGDAQRYPQPRWYTDMCLNTYGYLLPGGSGYVGYAWMAGTSMAVPKVAGIAALIAVQHPGYGPAQIKTEIYQTAQHIGSGQYFGAGLVDAYTALGGQ
jgi:subtilisin family serine protease